MGPVTEGLYALLLKSQWFRLVTREDMAKVMAEHNVQMSEVCDSATRAVQFGKFLNASKILIGSASRLGTTYQIVLKLVDVESGEIDCVGQAQAAGRVDTLLHLVRSAGVDLLKNRSAKREVPGS
jgi:hypothetical protein